MLLALPAAVVHAQAAPPTTPPQLESYRWKLAILDATNVAVFAGSVALASNHEQIAAVGFAASGLTYVLGGAVVHGMHGKGWRSLASIGLRIGTPIVGAMVGVAIGSRGGPSGAFHDELPDGFFTGLLVGYGVGIASAMVIDTAFVARDIPVRPRRDPWYPRVAVSQDRVTLGVGVRF